MDKKLIDTEENQPQSLETKSTLNYKERLCAFIVFNLLGYIIQLGSLGNFYNSIKKNDPAKFAFLYSIGNILSFVGTFIYVGVNTQIS